VVLLLSLAPLLSAAIGPGFDHSWFTVDTGGGRSVGGGYALSATAGQPDAGEMSSSGYSLRGGFWGGGAIATAVADPPPNRTVFHDRLYPNHPNPFNPATTVTFELAAENTVHLRIFNLHGERVRVLLNELRPAGQQTVRWNGRDDRDRTVASGVYFLVLDAGEFHARQKLSLVR
jgi:hypothetical protein